MKRLSRLTALLLTLAMLLSLVSIAHAEEKQSATAWLLYFASNHETDSSKFPWWPQHKSADQPSSETGVEATNAEVTGPGMYTVGLKFNWQKAEGAIQFNLVLDNAESLFPGYYVKITDIRVNGKSIDHKPNLYGTFHDDPNAGFAPIYNNYWDKNFSPDSTGPDGLRAFDSADEATYEIINPDDIVERYGADTLRLYEMFLGPLEQSKPWDTNGIDGVHKFLRRFWALFYNREGQLILTDEKATDKELKTLHKTIKKVREDIENFSFNTSVAAFMICLNELGGCPKREILEPLTVLLAPFAPHIAEELWHTLGHTTSVCDAQYPVCEEKYLVESSFEYPVSVNGKLRFKKEYALTLSPADIQADIVRTDEAQKWLEGKAPKKIIVVPGKIINIVI